MHYAEPMPERASKWLDRDKKRSEWVSAKETLVQSVREGVELMHAVMSATVEDRERGFALRNEGSSLEEEIRRSSPNRPDPGLWERVMTWCGQVMAWCKKNMHIRRRGWRQRLEERMASLENCMAQMAADQTQMKDRMAQMAADQTQIKDRMAQMAADQDALKKIVIPIYRDFRGKRLERWVSRDLGDYLIAYLAPVLRRGKVRDRVLIDERTPESVKLRNLEEYCAERPVEPRQNPRRADIVLECRFGSETLIFVGEMANAADADDVERAKLRGAWIRDHLNSDRKHVYVVPLVIGVTWEDGVAKAAHEAQVPCLQVTLNGEADADGMFIPEGIVEWHAMPDFERRMRHWLDPLWPTA